MTIGSRMRPSSPTIQLMIPRGEGAVDRAGRLRRARLFMKQSTAEFEAAVSRIVKRFFAQNTAPAPALEALAALAGRLADVVRDYGLPPPLPPGVRGEPGGLDDGILGIMMERVLDGARNPLLAEVTKQLIKACFCPEFKTCRDSYRETKGDGSCKRQDLDRVRRRASGSHCVDCPYWVSLTTVQHEKLLTRAWCGNPEEFAAHRDIFLPEDFRALRLWLHAAARSV